MFNCERHIGMCGTFDVENYGDLLFSLIADAELQRRLHPLTLHRFSYRQKARPDWPYPARSLADLPGMVGSLDGMIIGGGDLIRFDKAVAPGYGPPTPDIHHPTGYWLTPALMALQHGCPVVWNAPGVHGDIPAWAEPLVELVITQSSYVTVRNEASRQALSRVAGNVPIKVVPDTVFGVAQLVDIERPSVEYLRVRESLGLRRPYIAVQATAGLEAFGRVVQDHPHMFRDYQLVVLPIGPILGDDAAIFGDSLPGSLRLTTWPGPLLLTELIGHAAAVVGVSLHLAIAALACGVPVFRPAESFHGKYASLLEFEAVAAFESAAEIDPHWFLAKLERAGPSPAVRAAVSQLSEHWDHIASLFAVGGGRPATPEMLGRFWQSMPGLLETWATRCALACDERDRVIAERDMMCRSRSWKITSPLRALAQRLRGHVPTNGG